MKAIKDLILIFVAILVLSSCETLFFTSPHPSNGKVVHEIPEDFRGIYIPATDGGVMPLKIDDRNFITYNSKKNEFECRKIISEEDSTVLILRGNRIYFNQYDTAAKGFSITIGEKSVDGKKFRLYVFFLSDPVKKKVENSKYKSKKIQIEREITVNGEKKLSDFETYLIDLEEYDIDEFLEEFKPEFNIHWYAKNKGIPQETIDRIGADTIEIFERKLSSYTCE